MYTKKQIDIFNNMFDVGSEYTSYKKSYLTTEGIKEGNDIDETLHNTDSVKIALSNGNLYVIDYGESNDAIEIAINAFNEFIRLNYDEESFEKYLSEESSFRCQ